ncbi:MAG: hypothetical protein ACLRMJ_09390 [Alistipes finegoldii]
MDARQRREGVVKPTTSRPTRCAGRIGKGGLSCSRTRYYMGEMMPAVNSMSGVGKFRPRNSRNSFRATASVQPSVENYQRHGRRLLAQRPRDDAQLLYLNFTQPGSPGRRGQSHEDAPRSSPMPSRIPTPDAGEWST